MSKRNTTYYCNRPTLAARLIDSGYKPELRANPWNPGKTTWAFEISPALCQIVADYHQEIGKNPPPIITSNLTEGGKVNG